MSEIKLKRIQSALLTLNGNPPIHVDRIGKGRYSTAWKNGVAVYVQTHEEDRAKELLVHTSGMPHFPTIEHLGSEGIYDWYKMPLYQKLTSKHKRAWADYRHLQAMLEDAWKAERAVTRWNGPLIEARRINQRFLDAVEGTPGIAERYGIAVRLLVDWCATYGDSWLIETLQARNCAVDAEGELILLDPVFDLALVRDKQEKAMKKARGY